MSNEILKFGRLMVIDKYQKYNGKRNRIMALCLCECGEIKEVRYDSLKLGAIQSCGCLNKKLSSERFTIHGNCKGYFSTKEYKTWARILQRCYNSNDSHFIYYGARGIKVCDRWRYSFESFLEDMGVAPGLKYSIGRIDNDGDYCKENCKWETAEEQSRNKSNNVYLEFEGLNLCLVDWGVRVGLNQSTISRRLKRGWPVEKALFTPSLRPKEK